MQAAGKRDDAEFFQLVSFVVEVAMIDLLDKKMLQYLPSLLVAAAVHTALQVLPPLPLTLLRARSYACSCRSQPLHLPCARSCS